MEKLKALFALFRKGSAVLDPKLWKERQITANILAGVLLAIVHVAAAFGYPIPIDMETANTIAAGILGMINVVLTITTTDKIGLPAKQVSLPEINPESILPAEPRDSHDVVEVSNVIKHKEQYDKFKDLQALV